MKQILASRILMVGAGFCVLFGILYAADEIVTGVSPFDNTEVIETATSTELSEVPNDTATSSEVSTATSTESTLSQSATTTENQAFVPGELENADSVSEEAIIAPIQLEDFTPRAKKDFLVPSDCRSVMRDEFFESYRDCIQYVIDAKARDGYEAAGLELPERLQE